jgi:hypothetical protein
MSKAKKAKDVTKTEKMLDNIATHLLNFEGRLYRLGQGRIERDMVLGFEDAISIFGNRHKIPCTELFDYRYGVYHEPLSKNFIIVEETDTALRYAPEDILRSVAYNLIEANREAQYSYLIRTLTSEENAFIYLRRTVDSWNEHEEYICYDVLKGIPNVNELLTHKKVLPHIPDLLGLGEQSLYSLSFREIRDGKVYELEFASDGWKEKDDPISFDTPGMITRIEELLGIKRPKPSPPTSNDNDTATSKSDDTKAAVS